jgi:3-oxoacyl-[acyl-carrier-protein] synthase II
MIGQDIPKAQNPRSRPQESVFITGTGVVVCRETDVYSLWGQVLSDSRVVDGLLTPQELVDFAGVDSGDSRILGRHQLLAMAVTEQAWRQAGLDPQRNRLRGQSSKHRRPRFGCFSGTSTGELACLLEEMEDRPLPYSLSRWRGNSVGAAISIRFGLGGGEYSLNAASATGAQALQLAGTLIAAGVLDAAVVVAADPTPPPLLREAMTTNGSVSETRTAGPLEPGRDGMTPIEGAACVILESGTHAASRDAKPIAEWLGGGQASEAYHLLAPGPDGTTLSEILHRTLDTLGDRPADWISLHATGTRAFDIVEAASIRRCFPERLPWLSAFKRVTGHALGASGLIDAVLVVEGLRHGELPPWPHPIDPALNLHPPDHPSHPPRTAIQIGQGMGGVVVVNLLGSTRIPG